MNYYVDVVIPFILDVRLVDVPAGVTQDLSTFLLRYFPLFFVARRIPPFLSLVDREVELCVLIKKKGYQPYPVDPYSTESAGHT